MLHLYIDISKEYKNKKFCCCIVSDSGGEDDHDDASETSLGAPDSNRGGRMLMPRGSLADVKLDIGMMDKTSDADKKVKVSIYYWIKRSVK